MGATLLDVRPEFVCLWIQAIAYFLATCAVYRYQILHTRRHALERLEYMKERAEQAKKKD
jgi:ABC-2 type transport system permease protein